MSLAELAGVPEIYGLITRYASDVTALRRLISVEIRVQT
jgi:hypothetical protein